MGPRPCHSLRMLWGEGGRCGRAYLAAQKGGSVLLLSFHWHYIRPRRCGADITFLFCHNRVVKDLMNDNGERQGIALPFFLSGRIQGCIRVSRWGARSVCAETRNGTVSAGYGPGVTSMFYIGSLLCAAGIIYKGLASLSIVEPMHYLIMGWLLLYYCLITIICNIIRLVGSGLFYIFNDR